MRTIIASILLVFVSGVLCAQNFTLPLWNGEIPNSKASAEKEVIRTGNIVQISKVQVPNIAVFLPSKQNATGEAVLICPGGGYGRLAYDFEGTDVARYWNSKGVAALVLKYRLPSSKSQIERHKTPLIDAKRAMRITRYHAKEWNINPSKIGIMGFSAGGHLASSLCTRFDHGNAEANDNIEKIACRPDFSILVYPVISFQIEHMYRGTKENLIGKNASKELVDYYSNELHVTAETPPTILIHSSDDEGISVKNSLLYYEALIRNGVKAEMHIYPYGKHGYSLATGKGYLSTWVDRCCDFVKAF